MDDIVKRALAKWPDVPSCYGWLGLDMRGRWYLRDAAAQARGGFAISRGDLLCHPGLIDFIGRNYLCDADGQWYFQNGPQRVYVELELTPWVWRVAADRRVSSHTAVSTLVRETYCDQYGRLYVDSAIGLGLVHSLDVAQAAELIDSGAWSRPHDMLAEHLPSRFGYTLSPQARVQHQPCQR